MSHFSPQALSPGQGCAARADAARAPANSRDSWDRASWFALPNAWLRGDAPLDVPGRDPQAVLQAARADRIIVRR